MGKLLGPCIIIRPIILFMSMFLFVCLYIFVSTLFIRITLGVGVETIVMLYHVNVFIDDDNILRYLGDTSDYTESHENWFQGYKIDLITYPKPCNGYIFFICVYVDADGIAASLGKC